MDMRVGRKGEREKREGGRNKKGGLNSTFLKPSDIHSTSQT